MQRLTFRQRFVLIVLAQLVILLILGAAFYINRLQSSELDETRLRLDSAAGLVAGDLSVWVGEGSQVLSFVNRLELFGASSVSAPTSAPTSANVSEIPNLQAALDDLVAAYPNIGNITLIDPETGLTLLSSPNIDLGHDHSQDPFFQAGRQGQFVRGLVQFQGSDQLAFVIAGPVEGADGQLLAVAAVEMDLLVLSERLDLGQISIEPLSQGVDSDSLSIYVVPAVGDLLVQLHPYAVVATHILDMDTLAAIRTTTTGWDDSIRHGGKEAVAVYRSVQGLGASVVVLAERRSLLTVLGQNAWLLALALSVAAAVILGMTSLLSSWTLAPLRRITASAQILQSGDLSHRVSVGGQDEFGQLAATLNSLASNIQASHLDLEDQVAHRTAQLARRNQALQNEIRERQRTEAALVQREASFRDLFEHAPISLWHEDFSQVKPHVDRLVAAGVTDMAAYFGDHLDELDEIWAKVVVVNVNQACLEIMRVDDKSQLLPTMRPMKYSGQRTAFIAQLQALADGRTHIETESTSIRFDGQPLYMRIRWSLSPGYEESAASVLVAITDITDLSQATELIRLQAAALSAAANAIVITDRDGTIQWSNPAFTQLTGYTLAEIMGQTPKVLRSGVHDAAFYEEMWSTISSGNVWQGFLTNRRKQGDTYVEDQTITPVHNSAGEITNYIAIKQDVTERVQIEESLKRQLEELSIVQAIATLGTTVTEEETIIEITTQLIGEKVYPDHFGIMLLDEATQTLRPHRSYQGVSEEALGWQVAVGEGVAGRVAATGVAIRLDDVRQDPAYLGATENSRSELCVPIKASDGVLGVINAESAEIAAFNADDERLLFTIAGQLAIAIERARLFAEVQRRNLELTNLYDLSLSISGILQTNDLLPYLVTHLRNTLDPDSLLIALYNESTQSIRVAVAWEEGEDLGGLVGMRVPLAESGLTGWVLQTRQSLLVMDILNDDLPVEPRYMTERVARSWLGVPMIVRGRMIGVISVQAFDPHQFNQAHCNFVEALASQAAIALENARLFDQIQDLLAQTQDQAQQMQQIIANMPDGVLLLAHDRRVIMANPTAQNDLARLTGQDHPEVITHLGTLALDTLLVPDAPPDRPIVDVVIRDNETQIFEVAARPIFPDDLRTEWLVVIRNVTEERERQEYQQAQERLATVGQLSAGIAHDFNNILGAIILYAQMLRRQAEMPQKYQNYLNTISEQANHATNLVRQILDFSRKSIMQRKPVDLIPFLTDLAHLLRRTLPSNIHVSLDMAPVLSWVSADETRLQQALMNLAVNARDAMPQGGTVSFGLAELTVSSAQSAPLPDMPPGRWLRLAVADTGSGIPQEVQSHIFEPFFSTKDRGKGTGLGLAQVYGIVKQHDGFIDVQSNAEPGSAKRGTTFVIYLAALADGESANPVESAQISLAGTGETILIAEDNLASRMALVDVLEGLGYQVLVAEDGQEALATYQTQAARVDLILSDMVMPNLGGVELYQKLSADYPDLKLIIMTGYPLEDGGADLLRQGIVDWVAKPFTTNDLAHKLARALVREA